jgi:hypothetical protein
MAKSPAKAVAAPATPAEVTVSPPTGTVSSPVVANAPGVVTPPGKIDLEKFYSVKVRRVAKVGNHKLRPLGAYVVKGRAVIALGDAVASYSLATGN